MTSSRIAPFVLLGAGVVLALAAARAFNGTAAGAPVSTPSAPLQEAPEESPFFRFVEVGEGIWASLTRDELNASSYANAVVIAGEESVLVVDAHHAPGSGAFLAASIRSVTPLPVRWLVHTHWHGDHVWGTSVLKEAWPELVVLAHPATRDSLALGGERQLAAERERVGGILARVEAALASGEVPAEQVERYREAEARYRDQLASLGEVEVVPADTPVESRRELELGGRSVVVLHPGPAHTQGDLVVWVPDAGFLAAGDLLEEAPLWLEGADVPGWSRALDRLQALEAGQVLPAHGRLRPDAALLEAHAGFLGEAVGRLTGAAPPDSAALAEALAPWQPRLAPFGVDPEAFAAYVGAVMREVRGG